MRLYIYNWKDECEYGSNVNVYKFTGILKYEILHIKHVKL